MATLLLHKNRFLRAFALLAVVALVVISNSARSTATSAVTSIRLRQVSSCGSPETYTVKIGSTVVLTGSKGSSCTCDETVFDLSTSDPAMLALVGAPGCTDLTVESTGASLISWVRVDINRANAAENEVTCLVDNPAGGCATLSANFCDGYTNYPDAASWTIAPGDADGDGQNNCVDADIDGDGIGNALDNCPAFPNAAQTDTDGNGTGDACQAGVVAVPWLGSEALPHQVVSGSSLVLQAVAANPADGTPMALTSGTWDPGDGAGPQVIDVTNGLNLELTHTYTGSVGQPFTATVRVVDASSAVYTDTFKVVIAPNSRDTRVNMAIDKGLWSLHKGMHFTTSDGLPSAYWLEDSSGYRLASTASTVQAFEINNHREAGNPTRDPYVNDVARGLRYLLSSAAMQKVTGFGMQGANDPDANGNGFGLWVNNNDHSSYIGGQVVDAIVASGTPDVIARVGINPGVRGQSYKDVVQDLLDGYSWGMGDNTGGWHYSFNALTGSNDTSASHWWAIATLAAHTWNLDAPAWVKNIQLSVGVPMMQSYTPGSCVHTTNGENVDTGDGHFGYTNDRDWLWDNGTNTTAAGLILLNIDGVPQTNERFTCASQFLADRFNTSMGNLYTMYQTTKAMRTAFDGTGTTAPITNLNGTIDWYAGYADYLVANQVGDGSFTSNGTGISTGPLPSAWAIIILSPALFEAAPNAVCSVDSAVVCSSGATCGAALVGAFATANFSASQSTPGDNAIASYSWDFQDATTGSGVRVAHEFSTLGDFPVRLTVTDTKGHAGTVTCNVTVTDSTLPPVALSGGPYAICENRAGSVVLDATGSFGRGSDVTAYAWDVTAPVTFSPVDAATARTDQTARFRALGVGTYDIGLGVTDNSPSPSTATAYTTVSVRAANDAQCNAAPTASNNTYLVVVNGTLNGNVVTDGTADADADGDTFTASALTQPSQGTLTFNANGGFTYAPSSNFSGTETFTYRLVDQYGGTSNTATVTITVARVVPPVLTAPTGMIHTQTPTFQWNVVPNVTRYQLYVQITGSTVLLQQWYYAVDICSGGVCSVTPALNLPAGTHFTFYVQSFLAPDYSAWSVGLSFTTPPGAATLTAPSGTLSTQAPTYQWAPVADATRYQLYVQVAGGLVQFQQWYAAADVCTASACAVTPAALAAGIDYVAFVQTGVAGGTGPWSAGLAFTTSGGIPGATTMTAPTGAPGTQRPTYQWNALPNATRYQLYVQITNGAVQHQQWYNASDVCSGGTCSVTPPVTLATSTNFRTVVQAGSVAGTGPWSAALTFTTPTGIPGAATVSAPSGGIATQTPTYQWPAVANATLYQLYVQVTNGAVQHQRWYNASDICSGATCSVTPPVTLAVGTNHTTYVQTGSAAGQGPWSPGLSFVTPGGVPAAAPLTSPSGAIATTSPDFVWSAVFGATRYQLYVQLTSGGVLFQRWYDAAAVCSGNTCSVNPGLSLAAGASHTFYVQTLNGFGVGPWSAGKAFTPSVPAIPTSVTPTGTVGTSSPTFTWNVVSGATAYQLYVELTNGTRIHQQWYAADFCNATTCSVTPLVSLSNGNYRFYVQAKNAVGAGNWSSALAFVVSALAPGLLPF